MYLFILLLISIWLLMIDIVVELSIKALRICESFSSWILSYLLHYSPLFVVVLSSYQHVYFCFII